MVRAHSDHPGGVDVALLYGSVSFVKNTISPTLWCAHGTYAGGEVVSANSL